MKNRTVAAKRPGKWVNLIVLATLLLTQTPLAFSQEGTSTLRGVVTDASGALVSGAQVSISNQETGLNRRKITTGDSGGYVFTTLIPGLYRITVEAQGFRTTVRENITLKVGETLDLSVALEIGTTSETVTITSEAPIIATTSKEIGGHISQRELTELPSVNRNFIGFVGLLPGVVPNISTESFGSDSVSVNGQDPRYNNFLLDGSNNNDDVIGQRAGAQTRTALESIAEFQVLTNQFDAEFGRTSGGIINAITKSGTNEFHGSGFGFFQDNALNAATRFGVLNKLEQPDANMKQYGFTIGGPIKKDRAHFFFGLEKTNIAEGIIIDIPARPDLNDSTTEDTRALNTTVRFDAQPSTNNQIGGRWLRESSPQFNQIIGAVSLAARREESDIDQTVVGNWTAILGPTTLNDIRISFTRENVAFANPAFNAGQSMAELPPTLAFLSFSDQQSNVAQARINNSYRLSDTFSLVRASHSLKFGIDYNYVTGDNSDEGLLNGQFIFPTNLPFNAADPRTYPERLQIRVGGPQLFVQVNHNSSIFAQDSWRVNRKLTLNLGVRYDDETISNDNNNISPRVGLAFDPIGDSKTVIRGGFGFFYQNTPFELIGAFRTAGPFSSSFVRNFPINAPDPGPRAGRFPTDPTLRNGPTVDRALIASLVGSGGLLANPSPLVDNLERRMPYVRSYSAGFQRELSSTVALTVDYIHQDAVNQFVQVALNPGTRASTDSAAAITRRFATLGDVLEHSFTPIDTGLFSDLPFQTARAVDVRSRLSVASGSYNALQISLDKRFSRGVQLKTSYTMSNSRGNTSGNGTPTANFQLLDDLRLDLNEGPTDFDRRHNLVFSGLWEVPRTKGLIVSTIVRGLSGTPFTILDSLVDADRNGLTFDPLPAGAYTGTRTFPNGEVITLDFENEGGRNGARNPGFFGIDLRLAYRYNFAEKIRAGFTFEVFNLTNRVNYDGAAISGNFSRGGNVNFLVPTGARPARTLQLGVRVSF